MMIGMKEVKELFQKYFPEEEKGSNKANKNESEDMAKISK